MELSSIEAGKKVIIMVESKEEKSEFETSVEKNILVQGLAGLLLQGVRVDNNVIVFNSSKEESKFNIVLEQQDARPLIWRNVLISSVTYKNEPMIFVYSEVESLMYNRRNCFRLPMSTQAYTDTGDKIIIRDISISGVSFRTDRRRMVGQVLRIKFKDKYDETYRITGTIVREERDDDKFIYGCIIAANEDIEKFINEEQRNRVYNNKKNGGR